MACQDSLGQERDHLDPTDLEVADRNVEDIGIVEETEEDLEDLGDLVGLAVVGLGAEQGLVSVFAPEDEIRSEGVDTVVSIMHANSNTVERR
jgi:L-arabinose isomerase